MQAFRPTDVRILVKATFIIRICGERDKPQLAETHEIYRTLP